ncbi:hypothetical protein SSX86_002868 [Deinandra increscens subsp. villosa]|uniref:Fe2OG dioxygenase domain-containing protein n=1 Tax=Deinandra increscens subsp. villosa TaxID=3103831 RepID=A0AAP0HDN0_9ASTR
MAAGDSLPAKTAQQMAIDGDHPPSKYIINPKFGPLETTPPFAPAVNHGLSDSYLDKVRQVIKRFFELPFEEKRKYSRETGSVEGYGSDTTISENQVQDWCDRLSLRMFPEDQRKFRSGITLLLQDPGVEGLQVLNDGKWYMVPVIRDALFINLGDQMQIMSNGILKSPFHRVVTNKGKGRISVAMFTEPDPNKEIGPVDALVDEKRARVYKTVKNYGIFNYECFQKGIIALDAVKL